MVITNVWGAGGGLAEPWRTTAQAKTEGLPRPTTLLGRGLYRVYRGYYPNNGESNGKEHEKLNENWGG